MLNICELYALEHDIVFNPGKTRCMHFHNGNLHPGSVYFMNNRLQFTETCSLLGINVLPDFKADINAAVQQFNVKCISMLLDFKHLQCDVLSKLIGVYCLDVYGSQLWDYESGRAEVFSSFFFLKKLPYVVTRDVCPSVCPSCRRSVRPSSVGITLERGSDRSAERLILKLAQIWEIG